MSSVNQAGDWRVQLNDMRTQNALRAPAPSEDAVRRLSDRALRAAALNPDHSEAARTAAAAELQARGGAVEPWRPDVPSFLTAAALTRGDTLFFGWAAALRAWSGVLAALGAGAGVLAAGVAFFTGAAAANSTALVCGAIAVVGALTWLLMSLFRFKPARVCLMRPPRSESTDAPLRRMIARELRRYGHVICVARSTEGGAIRGAADYRARVSAMCSLVGMNASAMLAREAMMLSASDAWRPMLLDLVAHASDVLVVDVSADAAPMLDALSARGALARCVFVSIWGRLEQAEAALQVRGVDAPCFYYAPDGEMQRKSAFRAAMLAAMRAAHAA